MVQKINLITIRNFYLKHFLTWKILNEMCKEVARHYICYATSWNGCCRSFVYLLCYLFK